MENQKFDKYIFPFTKLKCTVTKEGRDLKIIHQREEGLTAFSISLFDIKIGLGPTDFKYFIEKRKVVERKESFLTKEEEETYLEKEKLIVRCHFKYIFIFLPIGKTVNMGEVDIKEPRMIGLIK